MITFPIIKLHSLLSLCIALIMLISVTMIYSLLQWQRDWALTHINTSPSTKVSYHHTTIDIVNSLPKQHLFGQTLASGIVPITNLQLRVTGIAAIENNQDHAASKAYISIAEQPSKIYHIGDTLGNGVKVYDIISNAVMLENDGHIEKLPLPREKLKFKMRNN